MSEHWKKHDRPCPPCADCGAELYEKFWGNGGWAKTEIGTDKMHSSSECVKRLKSQPARKVTDADIDVALRLAVEWLTARGLSQTAPRHKIAGNESDYDLSDTRSLAWLLATVKCHGLSEAHPNVGPITPDELRAFGWVEDEPGSGFHPPARRF